ncbi:hypothetical protein DFH09DRAFT_1280237 [Mycena vulgaris]|nr:hypothetical protein DFH09DRAFT_1280237 [Mycena vulgaris]
MNGAPVRGPRPRIYRQVKRQALTVGSILTSSNLSPNSTETSSAPLAASSLASSSHSLRTTLLQNSLTGTSTSHSHGPTPTATTFKSSRLAKPKVGAIAGGALAAVAAIFGFFVWRYLVLRATRKKRLASPTGRDTADLVRDIEARPPPNPSHPGEKKTAEPAFKDPPRTTQSKAQLRQQYLADELRTVQKQHEALCRIERTAPVERAESGARVPAVAGSAPSDAANPADGGVETATTPADSESTQRQNEILRRRIRELEEQQQSDWAQGLSDQPPPGYSE